MSEYSPHPPSRLLLWFLRLPIAIYRLGLPGYERLFGQRWIVVTTKGRRTGKPHAVMLDIVGHDPTTRRYYVQPGWGRRSAWVRNIEAHPFIEAQIGRQQFKAKVVDVSGAEGAEQVQRFLKAHPLQSRIVAKFMLGLELEAQSEEELREWIMKNLAVFGLDPEDG